MNNIQFQVNGQNYFQTYLSRIPEREEKIYLPSNEISSLDSDNPKIAFREFDVVSISTVIKDPNPPQGFVSLTETHYICSIVPTVREETPVQDEIVEEDKQDVVE